MIKRINIIKKNKLEKEKAINITRKESLKFKEILWKEKEKNKVEEKIINLKPDQLAALPFLIGINFSKKNIEKVVSEIKKNGHNSINLDVILYEADSKRNLLWWLDFFEKYK
jgi:hypothetical protein